MWWLLFPHQGLSSSNWWASWVQRTANTPSATQNTSEMPQRHRLELCRAQGTEMVGRVPRTIPPLSRARVYPFQAQALT